MDSRVAPQWRFIIALSAVLAFSLALLISCITPAQAHASARVLGDSCSQYETSNNPADVDPNCAYGAYQMSPGHAYTFAKEMKNGKIGTYTDTLAPYVKDYVTALTSKQLKTLKTWGKALVAAYNADGGTGSAFDQQWKDCSSENKTLFFLAQYQYCLVHYYAEGAAYIEKAVPGFKVNNYTTALKNCVFSTAIQHGPYGAAYYIVEPAIDDLGGWTDGFAESVLIDAIYYERARVVTNPPSDSAIQISTSDSTAISYGIAGKYLAHFYSCGSSTQVGVWNRLHNNERKTVQGMLVKNGVTCTHEKAKGGVAKYSNKTDKSHDVKVTLKTCASCKAVLHSAYTRAGVEHNLCFSGASWYCSCGYKAVVHSTLVKYFTSEKGQTLLSKASSKGKAVYTLKKNRLYQPTKVTLKSDGYYWGTFTVNGTKGYIKMNKLSVHGTASSNHSYLNGVCVFCDRPETIPASPKAGSYTTLVETAVNEAAYSGSDKVASISAGTTVTVSKLVKNRYNNWWAYIKYGKTTGYVELLAIAQK